MRVLPPVWEVAGLSRLEYSKLPWPEKRKLLIRHRGIQIFNAEHKQPESITGSYLLDIYYRENPHLIQHPALMDFFDKKKV